MLWEKVEPKLFIRRRESGVKVVAIRTLSEEDSATWQLKEFESELEAIGRVQHPNIVRLRAYYYADDEKLLTCDIIGNGSLQAALHGETSRRREYHRAQYVKRKAKQLETATAKQLEEESAAAAVKWW